MKVIVKAKKIDKLLVDLMNKYKKYHIAAAWASLGSDASFVLLKNKKRIQQMVVGTHFYQTHPDFINKFINSEKVKFILNTSGIFHPKVYLFSNNKDEWECLIGSANFTTSALSKNSEIIVHIKHSDDNSNDVYNSILNEISRYWEDAFTISKNDYSSYRKIWEKNSKKLKLLGGNYGDLPKPSILVKSKIFTLSWSEYFNLLKVDEFDSFDKRVLLLNEANKYFINNNHFSDMGKIERRELAGIVSKNQIRSDIEWGWFGSMKGSGKFQNRINENNEYLSIALDAIPLQGDILRSDYEKFVTSFKKAFPEDGAGVAIASRLLAMKRPDYFVCLDKRNLHGLCGDFGISKNVTLQSYWDDIIERIIDSVWYCSSKPVDDSEFSAWRGRVAMLDVIFYTDD